MEIPVRQLATPKPRPANAKPSENWNLRNLSGSLSGVSQAVDASGIPDHWKAAIKAELALRCVGELNFVDLDAHFFIEKGKTVLHYTATPYKMLV